MGSETTVKQAEQPYPVKTMRAAPTWGRIAALSGAFLVLVLSVAAVAFAFGGGRWGCKSQAELEQTRPPTEIVAAFADAGAHLRPAALPRTVVGNERAYGGANAFRFDSADASLWVIVCRQRCASAPTGLQRRPVINGQQLRQFSTLGNNVAIFITDNDRHSGRALQTRLSKTINDLDIAEDPDSRCYVE